MSVRLARQSSDSTEQQRLFDDARQLLRALDRLGPTGERMALWGSYHKKRACTSSPPDYLLVAQAARRYRRALELDGDRPKAYHELNARQLTAIVWRVERDRGMTLLDPPAMTPRSDTTSVASGRRSPASDFWSRSELGDRLLTSLVERAVTEQPSDETVVDLKAAYVNAFRLRSSAANRRSVIEHLEDIATLLPVDLELQRQLSAVAAELRDAWLPSATASPPSAVVGSPNADPGADRSPLSRPASARISRRGYVLRDRRRTGRQRTLPLRRVHQLLPARRRAGRRDRASTRAADGPPRRRDGASATAPEHLPRRERHDGQRLDHALDQHLALSRKLIVLCSPAARDSTYVGQEIERFDALPRRGRHRPGVAGRSSQQRWCDRHLGMGVPARTTARCSATYPWPPTSAGHRRALRSRPWPPRSGRGSSPRSSTSRPTT